LSFCPEWAKFTGLKQLETQSHMNTVLRQQYSEYEDQTLMTS